MRRRLELGMSQRQLATRVGVAQTTVAAWETDRNQPRLSMLGLIADALQTSVAMLLGSTVRAGRVLLRGYVGPAGRVSMLADDVARPIEVWSVQPDVEAIEVRATVLPLYLEGDLLLVDRRSHSPAGLVGAECLVGLDGGEQTLGRVFYGSGRNRFTVMLLGGAVLADQAIVGCRPVVGIERKLPV